MILDPLLAEAAPIPSHALMAIAALIIGGIQLALPKYGLRHRATGYLWVALMAFIAISGFFIHTIRLWGPFSPIHLLSFLTLYFLWRGVSHARARRVQRHKIVMSVTYMLALVVTGAFTLLPGRVMHLVVFG